MEDLTVLEKELERLKKKHKKGIWRKILLVLLLLAFILYTYDLFKDLEKQKEMVARYQFEIKKLKTENRLLKRNLTECENKLYTTYGGENGSDRAKP